MLGRECPRCQERFTIELERYEERGFMNLRCPYCKFISELDNFTTGEQRGFMYSTMHNLGRQMAEQLLEEQLDGFSSGSSGGIKIEGGDLDFGRVATEPPTFDVDVDRVTCDACGFSFGVESGQEGVCPVCR